MESKPHQRTVVRVPRVAWLLLPAVLLGIWIAQAPVASAGSGGIISLSPTSGPVGTVVTVSVNVSLSSPATYILSATTPAPASGGCATAQPIPGVAPITVGAQGGVAQFPWPADLSGGPYWLCAAPQNGAGDTVLSRDPFTVITGATPTPAVPVAIAVPPAGVSAGTSMTVTVSGWASAGTLPPSSVVLESTDGATQTLLQFTSEAGRGHNQFVLTVALPRDTQPGAYTLLVAGSGIQANSASFSVLAPAAPAPTPTPIGGITAVSSVPPGTGTSPGSPIVFIAAGVGLLLVAALGLLMLARNRGAQF